MRTSTSSYIVELPLRVNDQQNRFLEKAFEFGRTLYNAPSLVARSSRRILESPMAQAIGFFDLPQMFIK